MEQGSKSVTHGVMAQKARAGTGIAVGLGYTAEIQTSCAQRRGAGDVS